MAKRKNQRGEYSEPQKCRNGEKRRTAACIRTKTIYQPPHQTNSNASEDTCGTNSVKLTISSNTKNITKYDDDIDHSKRVHLKSCRDHMKTWFRSFRKRKFVLTDRKDFEALLGKGKLYADHMPASDLKLRNAMGKLLIDELHDLYIRGEADPSLKFWWVTFVGDRYMFNERGGTAEVFKLKTAVQAALGKYTSFSAIGVIENQAIVNFPEDREGKALSVHAHVLCWGTKDDVSMLKKHAKGFKSSITKLPIHSVRVHQVEGSFGRLGRYMAKPPYEGKEVNFGKLKEGVRCLYPARRLDLHHHLRLFEYSAKLPMEQILFGVGEGSDVRKRVVSEMNCWQKNRKGRAIKLGHRVYPLFDAFLRENDRLKNYKLLTVNYLRAGGNLGSTY